jgi:nitrite reductase/ring-hydroxylating ferredoxin subunit
MNPNPHLTDEQFQAALQQLDLLVREFELLPLPQVQAKVFEMLQVIDGIHREGVSRLVSLLQAGGAGDLLEQATADPAVRTLLLFYDLAPPGTLPAELLPASAAVNGTPPPSAQPGAFISLNKIELTPPGAPTPGAKLKKPHFEAVARLEDLPPGAILAVATGNTRLLLANVAGAIYAVGELCPGTDLPLAFAALEDERLICAWHNEVYDVRNGRCLDPAGRDDNPRLPVYPVAIKAGEIHIARLEEP